MGFEEMEPIFGRVNAEWSAPQKTPLKPFLFHVHGLPNDPSTLRVCATDFHSNTWEAFKCLQELEDMRGRTGIGGSWSAFVDYLIASVNSEEVKLVMDGQSKFGGAAHAKLVGQKAKGMPRITISFSKLVDTAATEAMANLSLELYKTFKNIRNLLKTEQQRCCELINVVSAEKISKQPIFPLQKWLTVWYQPTVESEVFFCMILKMTHKIRKPVEAFTHLLFLYVYSCMMENMERSKKHKVY